MIETDQDSIESKIQNIIDEAIRNKSIHGRDSVEVLIDVVNIATESCINNPMFKNYFTEKDREKMKKSKNEFFRQILGLKHSQ